MNIQGIERAAKAYHAAEDDLAEWIRSMEVEIQSITVRYLPMIKRRFERAAEAHAALKAEIEANADLFRKPKTQVICGVRCGFGKEKGKILYESEEAVIKRIEKHFPESVDLLIKTTKKPIKKALANLPGADLKKLGVTVEETGEKVIISLVASDVDKLIEAFRKQYLETEGEDEMEDAA